MPGNLSGMDKFFALLAVFKFRAGVFLGAALTYVRDASRMWPLAVIGLLALWLIAAPNPLVPGANPPKVGILAWLVCKEAVLAYLGYWIDRLLFPHSRPSHFRDNPRDDVGTSALGVARMAAEKRRAWIVCALMAAGGMIQ